MRKLTSCMLAGLLALMYAGPLCAAGLEVWTDKDTPTFDAKAGDEKLKISPKYDPEAEARRTAGVKGDLWITASGKDVNLLVEQVAMDDTKPDMIGVTLVVFQGPVQSGKRYTMPFGGGTETFPSLRVTATDASGSVKWDNVDDGAHGATYFKYATGDRTEEFKALARAHYARHNKGRVPPMVDVSFDGGQAAIHLYEEVKDNATTSHTATWNRYTVMEHTGCGEDFMGTEINLYK